MLIVLIHLQCSRDWRNPAIRASGHWRIAVHISIPDDCSIEFFAYSLVFGYVPEPAK